jgi:hypothetical protein
MESGGGGGGAAAAANNTAPEETYNFNSDPAIINFTWKELLEYNKAFLRGEKKATFYHAAPLLADQVPADLITLHDLEVFTIDGQGTELEEGYNEKTQEHWQVEQRAYLDGFIPKLQAHKLILKAKEDPEVILEVSEILSGEQLYLSPEITEDWETQGYVSLTRQKGAPTKEELPDLEWEDYTKTREPMGGVYELENQHFKNWYKWVCGGLCYFQIVDKEYGQERKSMPARMVEYLTAVAGGRRRRRRKPTRKHKKHHKKARKTHKK